MSSDVPSQWREVGRESADWYLTADVPVPDGEPGSHEWWRDYLLAEIDADRPALDLLDDYYRGKHRMAFATDRWREAFAGMLELLRDNWCRIVVDASTERLVVDGFRFGESTETDEDAARVWQRNGLDAEAVLAHETAIKLGTAYLVVGLDEDSRASIIVEDPRRARVAFDPARPRRRAAGVHTYVDENRSEWCHVWTPGAWSLYLRERRAPGAKESPARGWELVDRGAGPLEVPVIPLANSPVLGRRTGTSDLADVLPMQDAINKLTADMIVASEFAAFRQRWATGIEIPVQGDEEGEDGAAATDDPERAAFVAAVSRLWTVESADAKFGEFSPTDLDNYVKAVELLVQHVAAQTRTPPHYLMGRIVNASAEALHAAEAGLVSKVRRKHLTFGEGWEDAIRLALSLEGKDVDPENRGEVVWRDPETRTEGERVDALTKLKSLGIPREALWAMIPGATPETIRRWRQQAADEQAALADAIGTPGDQGDAGGIDVGNVALAAQQLGLAVERRAITTEEAREVLRRVGLGDILVGPGPPEPEPAPEPAPE